MFLSSVWLLLRVICFDNGVTSLYIKGSDKRLKIETFQRAWMANFFPVLDTIFHPKP